MPLAATLVALALLAGPTDLAVGPGSRVEYRLIHKFHEVHGLSTAVEGRARLHPDGTVQVMVRVPVASFDSGNGNRDAHMQEVTEAARFPHVVLKAAGQVGVPSSLPAEVKATLSGEVTFHGVTRGVEVPVVVAFDAQGRARADGGFTVSLEAFGVERPSLLFVKVDDAVTVTASLQLQQEGP